MEQKERDELQQREDRMRSLTISIIAMEREFERLHPFKEAKYEDEFKRRAQAIDAAATDIQKYSRKSMSDWAVNMGGVMFRNRINKTTTLLKEDHGYHIVIGKFGFGFGRHEKSVAVKDFSGWRVIAQRAHGVKSGLLSIKELQLAQDFDEFIEIVNGVLSISEVKSASTPSYLSSSSSEFNCIFSEEERFSVTKSRGDQIITTEIKGVRVVSEPYRSLLTFIQSDTSIAMDNIDLRATRHSSVKCWEATAMLRLPMQKVLAAITLDGLSPEVAAARRKMMEMREQYEEKKKKMLLAHTI